MDSAPETALAFSAVAPWERPGFAAHAIQYPEFPHPEYRNGNELFNGRFPSQKKMLPLLKDYTAMCAWRPALGGFGPTTMPAVISASVSGRNI